MIDDPQNLSHKRDHYHPRLLIRSTVIIVVLLSINPARAQSMDYGSLEQLFGEPVTTSATGSPQRVTEAPVDMTIITADEIHRSGARDIPGILRHVGGVDVMQWTNDQADVAIQGYDQSYAARTLVLIDGRQVYADFFGYIPWNTLPVELTAIRQIEIVKGANAALFGFNAVDGVINIITYNPRYDDVNTASVSVGTQGLTEISGVETIKLGTAGAMRLSGNLLSENEFSTPIPLTMADTQRAEINHAKLDANAVFALTNDVELDFDASHSHARSNDTTPGYIYQSDMTETNSLLARLIADTDAGLIKITAYNNWISSTLGDDTGFGSPDFHNRVMVVQAEDAFNLGADHVVRLALEYRYNTENTAPTPGGDVFYDVVSASAMWNWRIIPSISLTDAVQFDHLSLGRSGLIPAGYPFANSDWNRKIDVLSYNSGLVWKLDGPDTIRFTASRGVQLPSLNNAGAFLMASPVFGLTGIPSIKPTTVSDYQVTWDRDISDISARLHASSFYQRSENIASVVGGSIVTPSGGFYSASGTVGDTQAVGLELNLDGRIGAEWRWSVNYRAEIIGDEFMPFAKNGVSYVDYQHTTPNHVVKTSLGWAQGDWDIDAYLAYQSSTSGLRPYGLGTVLVPVNAFFSLDSRIAYRLTDWMTIAVSGQNLLQANQQQTSGPDVERTILATLSIEH